MAETSKSKKTADNSGVMDVSKPGKTPADASSRPLIVSQRPIVKDPTITKSETTASDLTSDKDDETPKSAKPSRTGTTIEPRDEFKNQAAANAEAKVEDKVTRRDDVKPGNGDTEEVISTTSISMEEESPVANEESNSELSKADSDSEKPSTSPTPGSDAAAVDTMAGEAQAKKQEQQLSVEEAAKQEALAKLIESKQYFVPISKPKIERAHRSIIVLLILLVVAAVGFELALDAGVVKINGLPPVTHFFQK